MITASDVERFLPEDLARATLVGRIADPTQDGDPCVVMLREGQVLDITHVAPTVSDLLEQGDLAQLLRQQTGRREWPLEQVVKDTLAQSQHAVRFIAPCDLQVIKACGVTFVGSMLERVIEEKASGDPLKADRIRSSISEIVGSAIQQVRPGSPQAAKVKEFLQSNDLWSQYLEVGIGPDAEVFTKAPVLSSAGSGEDIGILSKSEWNNPEPELVLAVDSQGHVKGVTLGNDVNLRDVEGRSALLLGKAKDNNGSCAIGPFIRIFDDNFTIDDARTLQISLSIQGEDGYALEGHSSLSEISRDLLDLVSQTIGAHHQYPDGVMLFTGTLFAPTDDRGANGQGFTHQVGDRVAISTPALGALVNTVRHSEALPPWTFGISKLMRSLQRRGFL